MRWVLGGLALAGVAVALVWWRLSGGPSGAGPAGLLRPDDAALLQRGEQLYRVHCASCHTWHHLDEVLFQITKYGVAQAAGLLDYASNMPAYGGALGDDDIVAALSWIKSRWTPETRSLHDEVNRQSRPRAPGGS